VQVLTKIVLFDELIDLINCILLFFLLLDVIHMSCSAS
jgi:hypothetical protein